LTKQTKGMELLRFAHAVMLTADRLMAGDAHFQCAHPRKRASAK
jgi:hypothetical protein